MNEQKTEVLESSKENQEIIERLKGPFSQSFSSVVKTYQLTAKGDRIVENGFKDVQKEIDSFKECALDHMLDKFLDPIKNQNVQLVDGVAEVAHVDLIDLSDMAQQKETLAVKYGLSKDCSLNDIYFAIKKEIDSQKGGNENEN